jgi:hypothetical protein
MVPSDFSKRAILALLAQRQIREAPVRVKSMVTVQQMIISLFIELDALQLDASARQTESVADLASLLRRQNTFESDHSAIEAALSDSDRIRSPMTSEATRLQLIRRPNSASSSLASPFRCGSSTLTLS